MSCCCTISLWISCCKRFAKPIKLLQPLSFVACDCSTVRGLAFVFTSALSSALALNQTRASNKHLYSNRLPTHSSPNRCLRVISFWYHQLPDCNILFQLVSGPSEFMVVLPHTAANEEKVECTGSWDVVRSRGGLGQGGGRDECRLGSYVVLRICVCALVREVSCLLLRLQLRIWISGRV